MKKKTLVILTVILILIVAGYLLWKFLIYKTPEEKATEALEKSLESAATGGVLPTLPGTANPLGENVLPDVSAKLPETNPLDATNPFKGLETNPF